MRHRVASSEFVLRFRNTNNQVAARQKDLQLEVRSALQRRSLG